MLELFLSSLLLGAIAGVLAGLFGLGGGVIIVPILSELFYTHDFPAEFITIMAVATSLATIIPTSISSIISHNRLNNLLWDRLYHLAPSVLFGAMGGAILANYIDGHSLKSIFIAYLLYVGFHMATASVVTPSLAVKKDVPTKDSIVGVGIGLSSALLGIGGGSLTVPYLVSQKVAIKNAVAISSACGLPIAISGAAVYIIMGWDQPGLPEWNLGYIYLPSFLGIILCSTLTAPIGAKLTTQLPAQQLKRYFSLVIFLIAGRMLWVG